MKKNHLLRRLFSNHHSVDSQYSINYLSHEQHNTTQKKEKIEKSSYLPLLSVHAFSAVNPRLPMTIAIFLLYIYNEQKHQQNKIPSLNPVKYITVKWD